MARIARIMTRRDEFRLLASMTHDEITEYLDQQADTLMLMVEMQAANILCPGIHVDDDESE